MEYEWLTFKEAEECASDLAAGCQALGLAPDVEAEGRMWKFMGIQSKNRKEWALLHLANMYWGVTTIALYDTLGPEASRFVVDQTELTTIACSGDLVEKILELKKADDAMDEGDRKLHRLQNLITFDDIANNVLQVSDEVGVKIHRFD